MKKKLFIVDDESDIRKILKINLVSEGYEVFTFPSAEEAQESLKSNQPDLIILDIMMDGIDGIQFCRNIREEAKYSNIPIIFLSAKSDEFDKILGLELGGDDYMTKPFSIKELKARIKAVLRRTTVNTRKKTCNVLKYREVELNKEQYSLKVDDEEVKLTKTEFNLIVLFMENPGKIFTRDNIIDSIRGQDVYVVDRTIDVHIMNLRKKLKDYKNIITTFSGVGYGFKE